VSALTRDQSLEGGCEQLILTCGPARGVVPTKLPDAAGRRAAENPASCELPAKADSQNVVCHADPCGQSGSDARGAESEPAMPGWGACVLAPTTSAARSADFAHEASDNGLRTHLAAIASCCRLADGCRASRRFDLEWVSPVGAVLGLDPTAPTGQVAAAALAGLAPDDVVNLEDLWLRRELDSSVSQHRHQNRAVRLEVI